MKSMFWIVAVVATVALAGEATAQSRWSMEFRAGGAAPTEQLGGADLDVGMGLEVTGAYRLQPHLHLYGGWGWHDFHADDSFAGADVDVEQTGYAYGLRFEHPFTESSELAYRIHFGGTYEHLEIEAGESRVANTEHGVGWEAGTSLIVPMGTAWRLTPGVSYRSLSRDIVIGTATTEADLRYVLFDVGLVRRF